MNVWPGGNCTPLAKKELFYVWPFGFTIWLCGITFIDRLNAERARSTIDELANKINRENVSIRVYIFLSIQTEIMKSFKFKVAN